ncbi:MAG: trypsin-like peptidase domain-containing protein [Candidatus Taylorbacteria bacterium]|nr:trypsin-like peptidase domain-containing protein [Candidatus Taylorbacteria bacterium]
MKDREKIAALFKAAVAGSILTAVILTAVGALLISLNKDRLYESFLRSYIENVAREVGDIGDKGRTAPSIEESLVVETVRRAAPAVVSIIITKNVSVSSDIFSDPFFNDFFGDFFSPQGGTERRQVGGGSGFFVSADGYIVTNRHVVADRAAEYTVFLSDGRKFTAEVVVLDPVLDIAVLKLPGKDFPYLVFEDSDKLKVGQTAIAIGNALSEFRNTVSVGVISGLSRTVFAGDASGRVEELSEVIQTDAAINPGNSGGPLLSLSGKVVGVNVAMARGSENIGFALPSNSVAGVVESVKKTGKIERPFLGVRYVQITPELKERNQLPVDYGVLITRGTGRGESAVVPGSPADLAGIVENDIILEADGIKLTAESGRLSAIVRKKRVGDRMTLKILHQGKEKALTVTLKSIPQ